MTKSELLNLIESSDRGYNLHTHTEFCDGKSSMAELAAAAHNEGFRLLGFSPHCPLPVSSPCNMAWNDIRNYNQQIDSLRERFGHEMKILRGMEVDYLNKDFGPACSMIQDLGLDYSIGSVHFVPTRNNEFIDCDGNAERFAVNLRNYFSSDLRYVVEKYFSQVMEMIDCGGFDILGHFDKIAGNASSIENDIEEHGWYQSLISDVIKMATERGLIVEINTKAYLSRKRFYPNHLLWGKLKSAHLHIVINSDAHHAHLINAGRCEAFELMSE